ncbi:hypothetical protein AURDEDRAFT_185316 [Auricularia subglabra TFB-10046 SS5]|nr:hypothetical protein AURDEDRAFT_185316 [Auricularia subglabra TFB-10046 SS5]
MYPHRQNEGDSNPSQYNSGQHAYGGAYNATQHTQHPLPPMRPMSAPGIHPSSMTSQQHYAYAVPQSGYQYDNSTYSGAPPGYAHWQPTGYTQPAPSLSQQTSSLSHGSGGQRPSSLSMYATGGSSRGSQPSSPHVPSPLSGATRARPQATDAAGSSHLSRRPAVDLNKMTSSYRSIKDAVSQLDTGIVDPTLRHQRAGMLQQAHHDAMHTLNHLDSSRAHGHIRDRHNSVHGAPATSRPRTMSSGDLSRRLTKLDNPGGEQRKCLGCDATATPEWRRGPKGPGTLCNACGLVYAKLVRSPNYSKIA